VTESAVDGGRTGVEKQRRGQRAVGQRNVIRYRHQVESPVVSRVVFEQYPVMLCHVLEHVPDRLG
jgi:hypothetical protein